VNKAHWSTLSPGSHTITDEQLSMLAEMNELGLTLHMEIESFYLFTKILLDRVANYLEFFFVLFIYLFFTLHMEIEIFYLFVKILFDRVSHSLEFYFGLVRNTSLDSHDQLTKNFPNYSLAKCLTVPSGFMEQPKSLKQTISDHRDYEIAHEKSPRTVRATSLTQDGKVSITSSQLYPSEPFRQSQTQPLTNFVADIDLYLETVINVVLKNREKTNLNLDSGSAA
jgi:hypothetical protein